MHDTFYKKHRICSLHQDLHKLKHPIHTHSFKHEKKRENKKRRIATLVMIKLPTHPVMSVEQGNCNRELCWNKLLGILGCWIQWLKPKRTNISLSCLFHDAESVNGRHAKILESLRFQCSLRGRRRGRKRRMRVRDLCVCVYKKKDKKLFSISV